MKTVKQIALTVLAGWILQSFLPWWSVAVAAAAVGFFFEQKGVAAFAGGFAAGFLLWVGLAFYLDQGGGAILSARLNNLLPVPAIVLTGLVGGLVSGFAALTGKMLRWR
jgi:hypothetical protein